MSLQTRYREVEQFKKVGSAHTRKLSLKSLTKNFKNVKTDVMIGGIFISCNSRLSFPKNSNVKGIVVSNSSYNFSNDKQALLCSVSDEIEADIVVSLLESCDIPVIKKRTGAGEYLQIYMGMSIYGANIFVPSKLLTQAKEILSAKPIFDDSIDVGATLDVDKFTDAHDENEIIRPGKISNFKRTVVQVTIIIHFLLILLFMSINIATNGEWF